MSANQHDPAESPGAPITLAQTAQASPEEAVRREREALGDASDEGQGPLVDAGDPGAAAGDDAVVVIPPPD